MWNFRSHGGRKHRQRLGLGVVLITGLISPALGAPTAWAAPSTASPSADPPGTITSYQIPSKPAGPQGLAPGPDGAEWFAEADTGQIARMTSDGAFTEFPTPNGANVFLRDITAGPDGAMWFTNSGECNDANCDYLVDGSIGRITMSGQVTEFPVPSALGDPTDIVAGPDGNLWFTEIGDYFNPETPSSVHNIGRITPAGQITEFTVPTPESSPDGIAVGPDGALWFAENTANKLGRITTSGAFSEFTIPTPNANPIGITTGSDGNLWFTEVTSQKIGRITPAGQITEFALQPGSYPVRITSGPDRALWFTEVRGHRIGRITTDGSLSELGLPSNYFPIGIAHGPRGKDIYFGALRANVIGKVKVEGDCAQVKCP